MRPDCRIRRPALRRLLMAGFAAALAWGPVVRDGHAQAAAVRPAAARHGDPAAPADPAPPLASASAAASGADGGSPRSGMTVHLPAPAASSPATPLPPRPTCETDAARCDPLTLERNPVSLPDARVGRAYGRTILAEGGRPPYRFDLIQGGLPDGLRLDALGRFAGTPEHAGSSRFRIRVVDDAGNLASQSYTLRVAAPAKSVPPAAPASAPASTPLLTQLDLSQAGPPPSSVPTARVYQIELAQLDALKAAVAADDAAADPAAASAGTDAAPAPTAPASGPDNAAGAGAADAAATPLPPLPKDLAWSEAQQAQLEALARPLLGTEYPTRSLFEAALDAQVCAQAWQIIVHEAQRLRQSPPPQGEFADLCPGPAVPAAERRQAGGSAARAGVPASAAAEPASAVAAAAPALSWRDLPGWLMPPGLRAWLADAAARDRPLQPGRPLPWTATASCNCTAPRLQQPIYALYPIWLADAPQPQVLDFSLINRISYMALPLGEDLASDRPDAWTEEQTAFIRVARAHETAIDFGIYRHDWHFLATEPAGAREALIQRITTQLPHHARDLLDMPIPGLASRAKAWLPGFGAVQRMGDGLTVFFDQVPDDTHEPALAARFADFYPRFVKGLAQAMTENRERHYALNLVLTDQQIAARGPFDVARLFDLLKAVEDPEIADGRIVETNSDYKRKSNVELRFLVLLSEPTSRSTKALRDVIGASTALNEGDRRILLRSVVPVLLLPRTSLPRLRDDLTNIQDNFGGVGFWPAPLVDRQFDERQAQALRTVFGPDPGHGISDALCGVICPNRWLFRLAFELLVLVGLACWLLLQWRCEWRARYGRYALLAGIPPLLVGAALLQCDPALEALRRGNAQLVALITTALAAALWVLLKRKEDKP